MENLVVKKLQVEYQGFTLVCHWYPSLTLENDELARLIIDIDKVNNGELRYGFWAPDVTAKWRREFMKHSMWCVVYKESTPCGLAYQYDLGLHGNKRFIHSGLVKLNTHVGKEFIQVPCMPIALGNLMNFGPYYFSNITHLPVVVDMLCKICYEIYPNYETQDPVLRQRYLPLLRKLNQDYIVPIVGYPAESLCEKTFRVRNAFEKSDSGFINQWDKVPKSPNTICNMFVKEWLSVKSSSTGELRIMDDLALVGSLDYSFMGVKQYRDCLAEIRFLPGESTQAIIHHLSRSA